MLYKAVVIDVIFDTVDMSLYSSAVANFNLAAGSLDKAPHNSCIVRYYGAGVAPSKKAHVVYPLLSGHLAMPIKPGECVWVFSPSKGDPIPNESYWLCRIVGNKESDDINYTHLPRTPQNSGQTESSNPADEPQRTSSKAAQLDGSNPERVLNADPDQKKLLPAFENMSEGQQFLQTNSTPDEKIEGSDNPFAEIVKFSGAYKDFTAEPIPSFYKRPGDLVLQGSNNSLICLGQDRGIPTSIPTVDYDVMLSGTAPTAPKDRSGTVDIVAGRSRYLSSEPFSLDTDPAEPERTNFQTSTNTRYYQERFKQTGVTLNALEGTPDFAVDAARIYVSMQTDGDYNFALSNEFNGMPASIVTGSIQPVSSSAYVVTKSDEVRIIARKQAEDEYYPSAGNPEINGSIKIVKEGSPDEDLAAIILQPDGTIQISGSRIFLGRHPDDAGKDESTSGPDDAVHAQPYVRYQQLEDLLNAILDNIDAFCDTLNTHVTPGYGSPSPQILEAAATLKTEVSSRKSEIETLKSERIFGE